MESILQRERQCFVCGRQGELDVHHTWHGHSNRKNATDYGLTVYLCRDCHSMIHDRPEGRAIDIQLKQFAQRRWEEEYGTREDFRRIFGKSEL
jgi:uncharacterized protein YlaI